MVVSSQWKYIFITKIQNFVYLNDLKFSLKTGFGIGLSAIKLEIFIDWKNLLSFSILHPVIKWINQKRRDKNHAVK
ncbi:hypothetical protein BpHYR1_031746 [Brachionus plicatilis]|uniref:Uncharacterized protein n=1 Tax=Brachionus plicatilis TaxID=10195 RepID=A0A3M7RBF2_BRAPC|nr:hypothetical protein BpHYR1_031746 [Brachionus plicatilis]